MAWSDLPPLNSLVPFEATVRLGSVTKAAAELHVTHGAVSRQLQALERTIGTELFRREGRTIVPTDVSLELHPQVAEALRLISAGVRQARPHQQAGPLVLSCEPTLMMRWLLPRLPGLARAHPQINLHLSAGGGPVDLRRDGIDLAIRRTDFPLDPGLRVDAIFDEWVGPVCAPETAKKTTEPADLGHAPRLVSSTRPRAWDTWASLTGIALPTAVTQVFEHFYLSLEAATAGLGVAIGPYALVKNDLDTGRLVAPFGFVPDTSEYVLLSAAGSRDQRIRDVSEWLKEQQPTSIPSPAASASVE